MAAAYNVFNGVFVVWYNEIQVEGKIIYSFVHWVVSSNSNWLNVSSFKKSNFRFWEVNLQMYGHHYKLNKFLLCFE